MKAKKSEQVKKLEDIPNIGPSMANDLRMLGISRPSELKRQDPLELYEKLNKNTKQLQDPCVLDTFMAAVDFMNARRETIFWKSV